MSCRYVSDHAWLTCLVFFSGECAYCGCTDKPLTADHLVPKSKGGHNEAANVVPACEACNVSKADQDWRDYMMNSDNFSQERMNRVFNWRRVCRQAKID